MNDKTTQATDDRREPAPGAPERPGFLTVGRIVAVTAAFSLMVGVIAGPIIANNHAQGAATPGTTEHTITVSGMGDVSVAPDVADVFLGVSVTMPTAKAARDSAATSMTAVLAAVKGDGVVDKDIVTTNVSLNPVYDYSSGNSVPKLTGYQYTNTIKATVRDLTKVAGVLDDAVAAGATSVQGISFRLDSPATVEAQARQLAMTDARSKGNALAQAAGVSIVGVASVTEVTASSPITYYAPTAGVAKDSVSTPIQSGTTDVTIQVTVSYLIG